MPFRIALSGLNAAQSDLNVTANNIANTQTNGFKGSRTEFADLFAVSLQGTSNNASGNGVRVAAVTQQFAQGNVEFTDSNLDLAISGQGMFILSDNGALAYSRAGAFQMNRDGYVVNSNQQRLQVYPPLAAGGFNTGGLADLRLQTTDSAPAATANVEYVLKRYGYGATCNLALNPGEPIVWEVARERHITTSDAPDTGTLVSTRTVNARPQFIEEVGTVATGPAVDVTETRGDGATRNFTFQLGGGKMTSATNFRAIAKPMPRGDAAPVMIATFPFSVAIRYRIAFSGEAFSHPGTLASQAR